MPGTRLDWPPGAVHCYLDADSPVRAEVLGCGFREVARLPGLLRREGARVDVVLLARG